MSAPRPAPRLKDQHIVVLGMGKSGQSAARLCLSRGARVTGADLRADLELADDLLEAGLVPMLGPHELRVFREADLVVASPGIPSTVPPLLAARAAEVPVWGELGLAAAVLQAERGTPVAAITGTNGKSTVTALTAQLLEQAGFRPFEGGNLGRPLSELLLLPTDAHDVAVVEVSSYQLELPGGLAPSAAAVLNLTPDHLARHGDMATYATCKRTLLDRTRADGIAWLPSPDGQHGGLLEADLERLLAPLLRLDGHPGIRDEGDRLVLSDTPDDGELLTEGYPLPGEHNRRNLAAAVALAVSVGARRDRLRPAELRGLAHRLEAVGRVGGAVWINDSKATNVDAALVAIDAFDGPQVVLLGGKPKAGDDYGRLRAGLVARAHHVVCFGAAGPRIAEALEELPVRLVGPLAAAVTLAHDLADPGDTVLLAPACSSFDEFDNFEVRGEVFAALVAQLAAAEASAPAQGESP